MKHFYMLLVSLLLVVLLILWIGPSNIVQALQTADWKFILLAAVIHLIAVGVRSLRWGFIIKQPAEFRKNYITKTIGLFAGNLTPMRSGGEILNAVAAKNINGISLSRGLSAGFTERFFDLAIVGFLLISSALLIPKVAFIAIIGGILSLGIMILIYFVNWKEDSGLWIYNRIHSLIGRLPLNTGFLDNLYLRLTQGLKGMIGYTHSFSSFRNLTFVFILSIFSWILECLRLYTVFYAFNVEISFLVVIIIFLLANVIGILTALPGGIGSIEISLTGFFLLFGVPSALAGSIALVDRLVSFWLVTALGIVFSVFYARNILEEIKKYSLDLRSSPK